MAVLDAGCAGCARTTRPQWYAYALVNDAQATQVVCTLLSVSLCFPSALSLSPPFLFPLHFQVFSFLQLNTINYDLHLRIIQTLCLHLSHSTPLRKTLTVNHYLRIEYFQRSGIRSGPERLATCEHCFNSEDVPSIKTILS